MNMAVPGGPATAPELHLPHDRQLLPGLQRHAIYGGPLRESVQPIAGGEADIFDQPVGRRVSGVSSLDDSRIQLVYGQELFSRERFSEVYDRHMAGVLAHFRERTSDLPVLGICAGAGWPQLCGFLGKPVPSIPFPRGNVWGGPR